ncbi:hypothetical protein P7K49_004655, partial [Saguinus oedipus]
SEEAPPSAPGARRAAPFLRLPGMAPRTRPRARPGIGGGARIGAGLEAGAGPGPRRPQPSG